MRVLFQETAHGFHLQTRPGEGLQRAVMEVAGQADAFFRRCHLLPPLFVGS